METNLSKEKFIGEILQDHRLENLKKYTQKWARPERACMLSHFSRVWLFATPWTAAHQALLSREFPRQEYWSGMPFLPPGDLPDPGIEPMSLMLLALAGGFFTTSANWEELRRFYKPGNRNHWTNLDRKVWPGCQLLDWVSHGHYFHLRMEWPAGLFRPLLSLPGGTAWGKTVHEALVPLVESGHLEILPQPDHETL